MFPKRPWDLDVHVTERWAGRVSLCGPGEAQLISGSPHPGGNSDARKPNKTKTASRMDPHGDGAVHSWSWCWSHGVPRLRSHARWRVEGCLLGGDSPGQSPRESPLVPGDVPMKDSGGNPCRLALGPAAGSAWPHAGRPLEERRLGGSSRHIGQERGVEVQFRRPPDRAGSTKSTYLHLHGVLGSHIRTV
uniref:Uncharacterized protein n=1 Tax=Molossus molossus TaxID=27622 RepID=A0A7J8I1E9_MOLMO|nr:hypothetical protein HJG59_010897 [Molossus molossus]